MKIVTLPCLEDSYSYLIFDEVSREGAVIDPIDPQKVVEAADEHWVDLKLLLTTHHHWDHSGRNEEMKKLVPKIKVYGGIYDDVQSCTHKLKDGDKILLGIDTKISCILTPSHTKGHMSYYVTGKEGEDIPAVFTGDTLDTRSFRYPRRGCGKFFEGTAEQMYQSLFLTLGSLPGSTRVYCDHEYTVKNMEFALSMEPENPRIAEKLSWAKQHSSKGLPTVPSTIKEELETNPFMRVHLPHLQEKLGCKNPVETMQVLRQHKDKWNG